MGPASELGANPWPHGPGNATPRCYLDAGAGISSGTRRDVPCPDARRQRCTAGSPPARPPAPPHAAQGKPTPTLPQGVRDVWFSNDGRRFVSTGYDKVIRCWDTETGAVLG